jgi:RimJ/RimL family protein N-acetyltransferase
MMFNVEIAPVTLTGQHVVLEPLRREHAVQLWPHANEPEIWLFIPYGSIDSPERMQWLVDEMLRRQAVGNDLPFAQIDPITQTAVGMTRYMTIERANKSLEIGGTWLGKAYRRTPINTEAKFLLMRHAFEVLGAVRLQLRTDVRNERSQRAIERIGAVREGVIRKHIIMPDGHQRSSVFYSVLDDEWPRVKRNLEGMLGR